MKKTLALLAIVGMSIVSASADTLLQFDFAGATATATSNSANSTFNDAALTSSTMTRGPFTGTTGNNNATNSFRWTLFKNDGISLANTDYFQFSLTSSSGTFNVSSIYGNFNGTASFSAAPGVSMAYAYSLDGGTTFTLMSTFTQVGTGNQTYTISGADATALTGVSSVIFRLYASGQTATGGWGLQSAATAGTIGLQVNGTITAVPEPTTYGLAIAGLTVVLVVIRRRQKVLLS
jgi:hypothetical protein